MLCLVTGSSGLIGSEAVQRLDSLGWDVVGVDNNMRADFFGPEGDTTWNRDRLLKSTKHFRHVAADIRDRDAVFNLFSAYPFDVIIHCAAQPSHDLAAKRPLDDFDVNAMGTVNLLEGFRRSRPNATFIFMSTNKVYGDAPNELPLIEQETRYDYSRAEDFNGISEECRIDRCLHSVFGASKVAADVMAQEYGRYFGLNVGIFRGGCLTGPAHSGVELHGFLSYLVHVAIAGKPYKIFGYKGKQVRDQIHSFDVIRAFEEFVKKPRQGEVYNLGGGRSNAASVLESIKMIEEVSGRKIAWSYEERNRIGDHICYISDLRKLQRDYPGWSITRTLPDIVTEMVRAEEEKLTARVG